MKEYKIKIITEKNGIKIGIIDEYGISITYRYGVNIYDDLIKEIKNTLSKYEIY